MSKEIEAIANCAKNPRDKAFVWVYFESMRRHGEILNLNIGDVDFDDLGARLHVKGKMGRDYGRIIFSVPLLSTWMNMHPLRNNPDAPLWVSGKLIAMLNGLSREDIRILKTKLKTVRRNFQYARARIARVTKNPRLLRVTFHTFRHWKATMEYHKAKDILHVMRMLGHRNINNTLRYTQLIRTEDDEFVSKVAKTVEEACAEPMICHGLRKNPLLPLNKAKLIHKIKKRV